MAIDPIFSMCSFMQCVYSHSVINYVCVSHSRSEAPPITGGSVKKPRLEPPPGMCTVFGRGCKGCSERVGGGGGGG